MADLYSVIIYLKDAVVLGARCTVRAAGTASIAAQAAGRRCCIELAKLLNEPSRLGAAATPLPPGSPSSRLDKRLRKPLCSLLVKLPPARTGPAPPMRPVPSEAEPRAASPLLATHPGPARANGGASRRTMLLTARPSPPVLVRLRGASPAALYSRRWLPNTSSSMCSLASIPHSATTSSLLRAMPSGCLLGGACGTSTGAAENACKCICMRVQGVCSSREDRQGQVTQSHVLSGACHAWALADVCLRLQLTVGYHGSRA